MMKLDSNLGQSKRQQKHAKTQKQQQGLPFPQNFNFCKKLKMQALKSKTQKAEICLLPENHFQNFLDNTKSKLLF